MKRASSVPSRSAGDDAKLSAVATINHESSKKRNETFDGIVRISGAGLTPSTTDESVRCTTSPQSHQSTSSKEMSQQHKSNTMATTTQNINAEQLLPHLPNITPVRGHTNYQGWL